MRIKFNMKRGLKNMLIERKWAMPKYIFYNQARR